MICVLHHPHHRISGNVRQSPRRPPTGSSTFARLDGRVTLTDGKQTVVQTHSLASKR